MRLFEETFGITKPIIGMCHLQPLPDEPLYNEQLGIKHIVDNAKQDIMILQNGGVHGILFSNEFAYPYSRKVSQVTVATMARIIGELKSTINIPFGVDCMYDAYSTIDLSIATESDFYRITMNHADISDFELGLTPLGSYIRYAVRSNLKNVGMININSSIESSFAKKNTIKLMGVILKQTPSYALCISAKSIEKICNTAPKAFLNLTEQNTIICDGGCNTNNIDNILKHTDGIIIGAALKENMELSNPVNVHNVRIFMESHIQHYNKS